MATHVQQLRLSKDGSVYYAVYDVSPSSKVAQVVSIIEGELPERYSNLVRLPVISADESDLAAFHSMPSVSSRVATEWLPPTHYQVYRCPMRSSRQARRLTVLWSFDGDVPSFDAQPYELVPIEDLVRPMVNGYIVAVLDGYISRVAGLDKIESRWTTVAGYNALLSAGQLSDTIRDPKRLEFLSGLKLSERRPPAEEKQKEEGEPRRKKTEEGEKPKYRRGKWPRQPKE